jgi:hypothetical protein
MLEAVERFRAWKDAYRFLRLPKERQRIVFYSEGRLYGQYFQGVIDSLIENHGATVAYLTSDFSDPILDSQHPQLDTFFIGSGSARTFVFYVVRAHVLVMTMPDLEVFHVKRSRVHPVHYVYLYHSMVSSHMIYRDGAFDHFDSILCVGPHHFKEIRSRERLRGLPEKRLFKHGYGPLDSLMAARRQASASLSRPGGAALNVLLAPSWGPDGILERGAESLVHVLLQAGYRVTVRPHPRTRSISGSKLDALYRHFSNNAQFRFDEDIRNFELLLNSDIMISDWSGVAMEFAFGLERPVIFMDVPRKENNSLWGEVEITPLEISYREQVGCIQNWETPTEVPARIETLLTSLDEIAERCRRLRNKYVFNVGCSGSTGAEIIAGLAGEQGLLTSHHVQVRDK